jgi:glucan 1,3-beta-glucosidase
LPSSANQARVLTDVLTRGKRENFRVNLIEAYDQPWKRHLEGAVGGHWGLLDDDGRRQKFSWGAAVSNHPHWPWQAAAGVMLVALVFAAALGMRREPTKVPTVAAWPAIALEAAVAGVLAGWSVENVPLESFDLGSWLRSLSLAALAIAAPVAGGAALSAGRGPPAFSRLLGRATDRERDIVALACGLLMIALTVLAVQSALALAFDPRYRDFPFAPITAAALPMALAGMLASRASGERPLAETIAAAVLLLSAIFIVWNETFANWQALWFGFALLLLAISLLRARAVPG